MKDTKKVLFVHDFPFYLDVDSNLYTAVGLPETYFDRFFDAGIEEVYILTRFKKEKKSIILSRGYTQIKNKNIRPFFVIKSYAELFNIFNIFKFLNKIKKINYFVLSTPSVIGLWANYILIAFRKKYSMEFAGEASMFKTKFLGGLVTGIFSVSLPYLSRKSAGITYVTNNLYQTYPNKNYLVASNVNLPDSLIANHKKKFFENKTPIIFTFIGGITKRKGIDLIIDLAQKLVSSGISVNFFLYGGHSDSDWISLIHERKLSEVVYLMGIHRPEKIFKMLQKTDVYIQPSYSEGLPRATIEAMSQGTPVVATTLPGFQEILDPLVLFSPGNLEQFYLIIQKLITDKDFYLKQSELNLICSKRFSYEKLHKKRVEFYKGVFK